ncbi:glycosyltransferase family 4 protein [Alteromonas confluentis]|uniref:Glycosyltransferase n=1 Tax=Alteromonas confluentis TaxID=1656094 RepID=A0A1E7ZGM7_9ALTE|nr:glycosyltransferase family 4 protein [Alteromonas confluentis]OFC72661.1 hypothetical protein BFC18_02085 [Alteromonas confluentis]
MSQHHAPLHKHDQRKIVIIGFVWPEPNSSAAGQNMVGLINSFLKANWQVTFMSAATPSEQGVDLAQLGVHSEAISLNCSSFDERIAVIHPDVVIFDRFMTEEQFASRVRSACPSAMRILNTEDLHSLRHLRHQQVRDGEATEMPTASVSNDHTLREIAAILRSDLTLIISSEELQHLLAHYPVTASQLHHVPLFTSKISTPLPDFQQRQHFVFIGNFRHAPNWDAVLQLQQIWPGIKKQLPHAELNIFGAYPPKKAMAMDNPSKGFRVRGWAASAEDEIAKHRVMLAPLRFGAGVKGKLVTAMQCGTPSVTSSIGAEGLGDDKHWPGMVTHNLDDFINAAVALYTDPNLWQQCSDTGQASYKQQFDDALHGQKLTALVETRLSDLEQWRQQQFLQSLLWHQTLRATQYMTQWIEAKNSTSPPSS